MPVEVGVVAFFHLSFYQSAASFHARHVTLNWLRMRYLPRRFRRGYDGGSMVYRFWILLCVLASVQAQAKVTREHMPWFVGEPLATLGSAFTTVTTQHLAQHPHEGPSLSA
eukprot:5145875-Amphidinium_carterae.1